MNVNIITFVAITNLTVQNPTLVLLAIVKLR